MTKIDTTKLKENLARELELLRETREEMCLQATLARAEARDEWNRLEARFTVAQEEIARLGIHSREAFGEIEQSSRKLLDELKQGYTRLRNAL